jgi:hypothetical protein
MTTLMAAVMTSVWAGDLGRHSIHVRVFWSNEFDVKEVLPRGSREELMA